MGVWGRVVLVTYLPLGSMTVETRLGGAVTPALSVVHIEVELEVHHLSVELDESVWVSVHRTRKLERGIRSKGERSVVVGDGMRRSEGDEPRVL